MINQSFQTPNFLTGLESTKADLQSKLNTTKTERATPTLNFKPQSVPNSTRLEAPQAPKPQASTKFQPNKIQTFLDNTKEIESEKSKRDAVIKMLQNGEDEAFIEDAIINKMGFSEKILGNKTFLGRLEEAGVASQARQDRLEGQDRNLFRKGLDKVGTAGFALSGVVGAGLGEVIETAGQGIREGSLQDQVIQGVKGAGKKVAESPVGDVAGTIGKGLGYVGSEVFNAIPEGFQEDIKSVGGGVFGAADTIGAGQGVKLLGKGAFNAVSDAGGAIVDSGKAIGNTVVDKTAAGKQKISDTKDSITTGLSPEQIKGFQANPYQANEFNKLVEAIDSPKGIDNIKNYKTEQISGLTDELTNNINDIRATKGETGKAYQVIRELETPVDAQKISNSIETVLEKSGMNIKNGTVVRTPGIKSGELNQADVSKFDQLYKDLQAEIINNDGVITPSQTLDFRKTISDLAKFDANNTTTGQRIMKNLRKSVDNVAKSEIPGLKELDAQFVDKLNELDNALRDLVYKGGDTKGSFRSNIEQIVNTLNNPNRRVLLGRLEEVMPGIKERVEAINNIPSIYKSMSDPKLADKALTFGGAAIGLGTGGPIGAAVGYIVGKGLDKAVVASRKAYIKKTLENTGEEGINRLKEINSKIEKNQKLSTIDKRFLDNFKETTNDSTKKLSPTPNKSSNNTNSASSNVDVSVGNTNRSNSPKGKTKLAPTKTPSKPTTEKPVQKSTENIFIKEGNDYLKSVGAKEMSEEQAIRLKKAQDEGYNHNRTNSGYNKEMTKIAKENGAKQYDSDDLLSELTGLSKSDIKVRKTLKNLTSKNIYNTSNTIAKQLGVPVKKVQEVIKEFVDKYGDDIKNKLGELADAIADRVGARAKLVSGEGTGISGKIDALSESDKDLIFEYTNSGGGTSKVMPISKQKKVSKAIEKLPDNDETVYSGQKMTNEQIDDIFYAPDDIFTTKRLISSSTNKRIARDFMEYNPKGKNKVMLEFPEGGKNISELSAFQKGGSFAAEDEVLFPIGQKFKVEVVDKFNNHYKLTPIYNQANKK